MYAPYLSGDGLAIRAILAGDAGTAARWFPGPFPVDSEVAGRWLLAQHRMSPWDDPAHLWLMIVRRTVGAAPATETSDDVLGSVRVGSPRARMSTVAIHPAQALGTDEADEIRAGVIRLAVPWLRDELEAMVVTVAVASDQPLGIAAAERLGMVRAARLREHVARPGRRVDLLWFQALGPGPRIAGAAPTGVDAIPVRP